VDSYFDANEETQESVLSYHEDSLKDEGMCIDPFTYRTTYADTPIQKPKEYFLMVFEIRIKQVKREWLQVVAKVQQNIREYIQVCSLFIFLDLNVRDKSTIYSLQASVDKKVGVAGC